MYIKEQLCVYIHKKNICLHIVERAENRRFQRVYMLMDRYIDHAMKTHERGDLPFNGQVCNSPNYYGLRWFIPYKIRLYFVYTLINTAKRIYCRDYSFGVISYNEIIQLCVVYCNILQWFYSVAPPRFCSLSPFQSPIGHPSAVEFGVCFAPRLRSVCRGVEFGEGLRIAPQGWKQAHRRTNPHLSIYSPIYRRKRTREAENRLKTQTPKCTYMYY